MTKRHIVISLLTLLPAVLQAQSTTTTAPPWSAAPLLRGNVPVVYVQQWSKARNRSTCDLFGFSKLGAGAGATPRAATFSGGWAVAYDRPGLRSAFGIAGTGLDVDEGAGPEWPFNRVWSDGSHVGYGPEAGSGPDFLAYLAIDGQSCLYNVWSKLGQRHLEELLEGIRAVRMLPSKPEP